MDFLVPLILVSYQSIPSGGKTDIIIITNGSGYRITSLLGRWRKEWFILKTIRGWEIQHSSQKRKCQWFPCTIKGTVTNQYATIKKWYNYDDLNRSRSSSKNAHVNLTTLGLLPECAYTCIHVHLFLSAPSLYSWKAKGRKGRIDYSRTLQWQVEETSNSSEAECTCTCIYANNAKIRSCS